MVPFLRVSAKNVDRYNTVFKNIYIFKCKIV